MLVPQSKCQYRSSWQVNLYGIFSAENCPPPKVCGPWTCLKPALDGDGEGGEGVGQGAWRAEPRSYNSSWWWRVQRVTSHSQPSSFHLQHQQHQHMHFTNCYWYLYQGSQQQEVKFQDQIFRKFQYNFRTLGMVGVGGCLSPIVGHFKSAKVTNFDETPRFVSFRTK